jgi:RNA polymerase subunit RPABC4/transcription elongation factor Spt4
MKTKECPSCAMEVPENSKVCHICGHEFVTYSGWIKWTAILLLILFFLFYFIR